MLGNTPVPLDRFRRYSQQLGGFLHVSPAKNRSSTILDAGMSLASRTNDSSSFRNSSDCSGENTMPRPEQPSSGHRTFPAGDSARDQSRFGAWSGRRWQRMRATLPVDGALLNQFEIGLIDQRGGLESVVGTLSPHMPFGQPVGNCCTPVGSVFDAASSLPFVNSVRSRVTSSLCWIHGCGE